MIISQNHKYSSPANKHSYPPPSQFDPAKETSNDKTRIAKTFQSTANIIVYIIENVKLGNFIFEMYLKNRIISTINNPNKIIDNNTAYAS